MNFSLQSLSKSTSNYENRSDSPPGQVLDVKITKTEDKTKSEIETTKEIRIILMMDLNAVMRIPPQ